MISRQHIRQFLAVVETGSFSQAAGRIGVTQPTLSAGIAEIERQVGGKLFIRDRKGIRLTQTGGRMLEPARAIDREFRLVEAVGSEPTLPLRSLRLGVLSSLSTDLLESIVGEIAGFDGLSILEGSVGELRARLSEGKLDAAITLIDGFEPSHTVLPMYEEGYAMMLPANHRLACQEIIHAHELVEEVMIARRSCEILRETSRFFTQRGVRPHFGLRGGNDDRCMAMVKAGLGVTTAPETLLREGIVSVKVAAYDYRRKIGLICSRRFDTGSIEGRKLAEVCSRAAVGVTSGSR